LASCATSSWTSGRSRTSTTTHEVAKVVGKAEFTVREWCRLGRVAASKRACGRGKFQEWIVSHEELTRLRNEGLLPIRKG